MAYPEDETYSVIFRSLRHPLRRKILRLLSESPRGFSEIQEILKIESPHLTYHIESLGNLVSKTEDAKYHLSSFGKAAVDMMTHVEEPSKTAMNPQFSPKKWKAILALMLVGIVVLSGLCYLQYQTLTRLSDQYSSLNEQLDVLKESLGMGNAVLTKEHSETGTVATALMTEKTENGMMWYSFEPVWGHDVDWYRIYSLADNSTLEIEISITGSDLPAGAYLSILGSKETITRSCESIDEPPSGMTSTLGVRDLEFWERVNNTATYSKTLPSRGFYIIQVVAPGVWNMTNHYIMNYSVTLRITVHENQVPFFVENRTQAFLLGASPDFFDEYPFRRLAIAD